MHKITSSDNEIQFTVLLINQRMDIRLGDTYK